MTAQLLAEPTDVRVALGEEPHDAVAECHLCRSVGRYAGRSEHALYHRRHMRGEVSRRLAWLEIG